MQRQHHSSPHYHRFATSAGAGRPGPSDPGHLTDAPAGPAAQPILEVRGVSKRFGRTVALEEASFAILPGEIHALLGENGAGKSTLIKILSGLHKPDEGYIRVATKRVAFRGARDALKVGIACAQQELTLAPDMTVGENLLLGREPVRGVLVSSRRVADRGAALLHDWGISDVDSRMSVAKLSLGARQRVEIVRALSRATRVLILDEPTSALTPTEVQWLFAQLRRVREAGIAVIYISHRMGEISEICDRLTVLRNGHSIGTLVAGSRSDAEVVEMMLGGSLARAPQMGRDTRALPTRVLLSVKGLASGADLVDGTFDLHCGEILGVAALQGHGQASLFMSLFGAQSYTCRTLTLNGDGVKLRSPRAAIRLGIGFVPEDRQTQGILPGMSIAANVSLPTIARHASAGVIRGRRERNAVRDALATFNISKDLDADVATLSGGNQQKLVLAKWLVARTRILLMFDATRGVDVGTKAEIFGLMRQFAHDGGSILFYSTDVQELTDHTDRVAVLYRGSIRTILDGEDLTETRLLAEMLGGVGELSNHA